MNPEIFYFGCWREPGHYLYTPSGQPAHKYLPSDFPLRDGALDGALLPPQEPQIPGRAVHFHIGDWTVMTFWDRSVDNRRGSSSSFVVRGTLGFEDTVAAAKTAFPAIWARFNFEVRAA